MSGGGGGAGIRRRKKTKTPGVEGEEDYDPCMSMFKRPVFFTMLNAEYS